MEVSAAFLKSRLQRKACKHTRTSLMGSFYANPKLKDTTLFTLIIYRLVTKISKKYKALLKT